MENELDDYYKHVERIVNKLDDIGDLARTILDSASYSVENSDNCNHLIAPMKFLADEIDKIASSTDNLGQKILQHCYKLSGNE